MATSSTGSGRHSGPVAQKGLPDDEDGSRRIIGRSGSSTEHPEHRAAERTMLSLSPPWWNQPPVILRYAVAVLSVIAALIVLWWMNSVLQAAAHVSLFLCAVMFSAWFGGFKPGLLAIAFSLLTFKYYFLPPIHSLELELTNNANACLGLLPSGRADLDEVRDALADIVTDADRASAIIERVRGLAKRSSPEQVPLQLVDVVADIVALAAAESVARRVAIRTDIPTDLPVVLGDRVQLQQVLLNLVVNGMDAMSTVDEPERKLEIRGRPDTQDGSPAARISVQDRGIGLHAGQADRLFEAFYTTKPHGMGMGLAISRSIIEAHGGRLWAESNRGAGATFSFRLPAAAASVAP